MLYLISSFNFMQELEESSVMQARNHGNQLHDVMSAHDNNVLKLRQPVEDFHDSFSQQQHSGQSVSQPARVARQSMDSLNISLDAGPY